MAQIFELVKILKRCVARRYLFEHFEQAFCADAARRTFAAGFVYGKIEEELGNIHHTVVLVHYYESARAHHTAYRRKIVVVNGSIHKRSRYASARGAACLSSLKLFAAGYAAAYLLNYFAESCTHGDFDKSRIFDFAAESEYLCSL